MVVASSSVMWLKQGSATTLSPNMEELLLLLLGTGANSPPLAVLMRNVVASGPAGIRVNTKSGLATCSNVEQNVN